MSKIPFSEMRFILDESKIHAQEVLAMQLKGYNAIDIAEILEELEPEDKIRLFTALTPEAAAEVLDETDSESRDQILSALPPEHISDLVEEMPPDEGADIIQQLPSEKEAKVLEDMADDYAAELKELTTYDPDTAGGMMTTDFAWVKETETAAQALGRIRKEEDMEHVGEIYVLDGQERLRGLVPIKTLLAQPPHVTVETFMTEGPHAAALGTDQEDVAILVQKYNLPSLPVVDGEGVLKGVITLDDVMDVMEEEVDEDMFRLAGTLSRDLDRIPISRKFLKRFPFLLTTFLGGIMTILIQYFFRFSTDELIAITFFIPIINGLAGNVGLQSSTVMVRGFATGEISLDRIYRLLPLEMATGAMIGLSFGLLCGTLTALAASALDATPFLGLVVGVSICLGTTVASTLGVLVPAACEKVGIDPAVSAGPFIATLLDSTALLIYLGIATLMLTHLQL